MFSFKDSVSKPSKVLDHISPQQILSELLCVPGSDEAAVNKTGIVPGLQTRVSRKAES